jgi:hypothetical protein
MIYFDIDSESENVNDQLRLLGAYGTILLTMK